MTRIFTNKKRAIAEQLLVFISALVALVALVAKRKIKNLK